jgi:phospholipase C
MSRKAARKATKRKKASPKKKAVLRTRAPADPIRHVVLLMLENRSFDQMLGGLKELFPGLEGIDRAKPNVNKAPDKTPYPQQKTEIRRMELDPKHERKNVRTQLLHGNAGFVIDFVDAYKSKATPERIRGIMGYYERGTLPALQQLAEHFTLCDHWHASVPGPTALSGSTGLAAAITATVRGCVGGIPVTAAACATIQRRAPALTSAQVAASLTKMPRWPELPPVACAT